MSDQNQMPFNKLVKRRRIDLIGEGLHDEDIEVITRVIRESEVLEVLLLGKNRLNLADGKFTDALAHNNTLITLNLHHNHIDDEGASKLAAALKLNNTLRNIHLGYNLIGEDGAKNLADSFAANRSLHAVWMWGNRSIGEYGAQKLADALASKRCVIKHLHMRDNHISRHEMMNIKTIHKVMQMEEEMKRKDEALALKDRQIASLEAALRVASLEKSERTLEIITSTSTTSLHTPRSSPIEKRILDSVSLASEETEKHESCKRARISY